MIGRVVSVKMKDSVAVLVEGKKMHPLYKKSFVWSKKYLAGDSFGAKVGDIVEIIKCAPISKRKHFKVTKVMGTDVVALGEEHMIKKAQEAIEEVMPEEEEKVESVSSVEPVESVNTDSTDNTDHTEKPKTKKEISKEEKVSKVSKAKKETK